MAVIKQKLTKRFAVYNGDCCEVLAEFDDDSIGFSIFSPPFADLYSYSDDDRDMSNCSDYDEFFNHFQFLVEHLNRVTMPGRIVAVHCMDLPTFKSKGEEIGMRDFPGDIVRMFQGEGFVYHSRHCIWKDPLLAAVRTKAIGLAHKQIVKDSSICRMGIPDYVLAFRMLGDNPVPISHGQGLTEYHGGRDIPGSLGSFEGWDGAQGKNKRSHWIWQQYASPVWFDIRQTNVLPFREGRQADDQRHICPLQLDVIERCVELWSTRGDSVLTPFMGVGSEVYVAVKNHRKGIGIELKSSYYRQALRNLAHLRDEEKSTRLQEKS